MNLVLDFGNSVIKTAIFEKNEIRKVAYYSKISQKEFRIFCAGFKADRAICSSVVRIPVSLELFLKDHFSLILLKSSTPLPFINLYRTPGTLGSDRLACVAAASAMFPATPVLSVDAGTCIKLDFVNSKNEYLGGSISPGLRMRLKALHTFTARLPLLELEKPEDYMGKDTRNSILSGVVTGAAAEIDGLIDRYRKNNKELRVVLTGGDMTFFENTLKNRTFAVPHLLLNGLNHILNYNASEKK